MTFDGAAFVRTLPASPGVYRMYDAGHALLYVGKAKHLRRRVASYFRRPLKAPRLTRLVSQVAAMDFTVTRTEAEALVLESQLIKTLRPRYNIQLRDDKGYPFLCLTVKHPFPRLFVHRGKPLPGTRLFGPFPHVDAVRHSMTVLQKTFQLRNCDEHYFRHRSRPCLQEGIGRCSAPCVGWVTQAEYQEQVKAAIAFLEGKDDSVMDTLVAAMERASLAMDFEAAARWRDRIADLRSLQAHMDVRGTATDRDVVVGRVSGDTAAVTVMRFRQGQSLGAQTFFPSVPLGGTVATLLAQFLAQHYLDFTAPAELVLNQRPDDEAALTQALSDQAGHRVSVRHEVRGERARQLALALTNLDAALTAHAATEEVGQRRRQDLARLLGLATPPQRMECFDISHTRGEATVASCVVFGPQGPDKAAYRRYNITDITPGDDYAAMHQALTRRFRRLAQGEGDAPEVLLIDGGAGQVEQALAVLRETGVADRGIRVVGVAKGPARRPGEETLVRPGLPDLHPGPASPGLQLIQAVRDEAHRFAITGHRRRRQAARDHSSLEDIPGIGPARRQALLRAFGGWQGVLAAGVDELTRVPGINLALATRLHQTLHAT